MVFPIPGGYYGSIRESPGGGMVHILVLGSILRPELLGLWEEGAMNPLPIVLGLGAFLACFWLLSRSRPRP